MVVAPARCAMKSSSAGSIIKSFPEMAYHDGSVCHATGPDGVGAMEKLSGICSAFRVASRFGLRSWQKNCAKKAGAMKAGDAKGVPVQMRWLNASEVWKPAPRLKIESPCSGTNAALKTRPSTSDRPYAAFEITIPPYECPTRIFGPDMPSSTARTIATSPAIDNRPSVGVTVVNPSFSSPATTMSQPGGEAQAPWTRTIVGLVSELFARAVAGKTETIRIAAMTIMSRSNCGLAEPRAGRWAGRANEAFIQKPSRARLNRVYKGETDRDYIDGSWRVRNPLKALQTHEASLGECRQRRVPIGHLSSDEPSACDKIACSRWEVGTLASEPGKAIKRYASGKFLSLGCRIG